MEVYNKQIEVDSKTEELVNSKTKPDGSIDSILSRSVCLIDVMVFVYNQKVILKISDITKNGMSTVSCSQKRNLKINNTLSK